jgi:hypothetical protein
MEAESLSAGKPAAAKGVAARSGAICDGEDLDGCATCGGGLFGIPFARDGDATPDVFFRKDTALGIVCLIYLLLANP